MPRHTCETQLHSSKGAEGCSCSLQDDIALVLLQAEETSFENVNEPTISCTLPCASSTPTTQRSPTPLQRVVQLYQMECIIPSRLG